LKEKEFPIDLLILVPGRRGNPERSYVIDALQKIIAKPPKNINDLEFIDYTIEKKRRQIASRNHVRLCTFHSARGIEAHRVLLFGFEMIDKTIQKQYLKNLGYISLSRSLFELVIAIRISQRTEFICFIEETLNQLQHIKNRPKPVKQSPRSRAMRVSPEREPRSKRSKHRGIKPKKIKTESNNSLMLKNLINDKKTPQRARLEHLKNHITELTSLNKSEWENFTKIIRKKINSPKLRDERDSLLASIRSKVS
jgi:hypothetical protein